jgi:AcrR family transcriptional regulator
VTKREAILEAAIREFADNSYDAASINRIIKMSDTSKGTFYHYFSDKMALYMAIVDDLVQIKKTYFSQMQKLLDAGETSIFALLKEQARAGTRFMHDNPGLYRFGLRFARETGPVKEMFAERYLPDLQSAFQQIVATGIANLNLADRYTPEFVVRLIGFTMMHYDEILIGREEDPTPEQIEERLDMLFDFLQRGLEAGGT